MIKFNRATEYGLMALGYIRNKKTPDLTSAREISDKLNLPFEILAKTLQKLKDQGVIGSTYGTRGGYKLARELSSLSLLDFLKIMEGSVGVVSCTSETTEANMKKEQPCACEYETKCSIKPAMSVLNTKMYEFMRQISVEELTRESSFAFPFRQPMSEPIAVMMGGDEP